MWYSDLHCISCKKLTTNWRRLNKPKWVNNAEEVPPTLSEKKCYLKGIAKESGVPSPSQWMLICAVLSSYTSIRENLNLASE